MLFGLPERVSTNFEGYHALRRASFTGTLPLPFPPVPSHHTLVFDTTTRFPESSSAFNNEPILFFSDLVEIDSECRRPHVTLRVCKNPKTQATKLMSVFKDFFVHPKFKSGREKDGTVTKRDPHASSARKTREF